MRLQYEDYPKLLSSLAALELSEAKAHCRNLCRTDLYFLIRYGLNRPDVEKRWLFERCREVEAAPNDFLDLWAREHYKSTIITFAKTIQDILASHGDDPLPVWHGIEVTVGLFSHTRPIAKAFLRQIKQEFETNKTLVEWFPDIIWDNPKAQAPKWSEDEGIVLKRKSNPKESTVEAWGVVDGQPVSKHFTILLYDDIVVPASVTTPEQMAKTTEMLEISYNLGSEGGKRRFIGTRYHFNDSYKTILDRRTAAPRVYPATADGTVEGEPVLLTTDSLMNKRRDMGPYTFSCFEGSTKILMADWLEKPIGEVQIGDTVVGYTFGNGSRARLTPTKVVARQKRTADVVRLTFVSGRSVVCTPDHKFWHGRAKRGYSPIGFAYGHMQAACVVYDPMLCSIEKVPEQAKGYIAGFFDGEGSVSGKAFHFAQDREKNGACCQALERALKEANLPYHICNPLSRPTANDYFIIGGRSQKIRFARIMKGYGKAKRVAQALFDEGTRNIGKGNRDKLVSIEPLGKRTVYNIQTETGNYVAAGYAAKNCQMLQNPVADDAQGFRRDWLRHHQGASRQGMNVYMLVDAANSKRKTSDYTAIWVVGYGSDENLYVLDIVRDRMNLTERTKKVMELHRKWKPMKLSGVRYETYGLQGDVEHLKAEMKAQTYHFDITEVGGTTPKSDRIRRLVPWFEQGRIYLPASLHYTQYDRMVKDLVRDFIEEEYMAFPVSIHDDMLDSLARIAEPGLPLEAPNIAKSRLPQYSSAQPQGWMG